MLHDTRVQNCLLPPGTLFSCPPSFHRPSSKPARPLAPRLSLSCPPTLFLASRPVPNVFLGACAPSSFRASLSAASPVLVDMNPEQAREPTLASSSRFAGALTDAYRAGTWIAAWTASVLPTSAIPFGSTTHLLPRCIPACTDPPLLSAADLSSIVRGLAPAPAFGAHYRDGLFRVPNFCRLWPHTNTSGGPRLFTIFSSLLHKGVPVHREVKITLWDF